MKRDDVLDTNRRLAISMDLEYEMAMYDDTRANLIRRLKAAGEGFDQRASLQDQVELSVDSLARLLQIKPGNIVPDAAAEHIAVLVSECYPSASIESVETAVETHPIRTAKPSAKPRQGKAEAEKDVLAEESEL